MSVGESETNSFSFHSKMSNQKKKKTVIGNMKNRYTGFDPWAGKIPWSRAWQPTPVFLHGESPWTEVPGGLQSIGVAESGMIE